MVLVLFLLGIEILVIVSIMIIMLSVLKINIQNNETKIGVYLFGKIPIIKVKPNRVKIGERLKKFRNRNKIKLDRKTIEIIEKLPSKIEKLELDLKIGTEDAIYTAFAVYTISIAISVILPYLVEKKNYDKIKYKIQPIYNGKNQIDLKLNCIIYVKMVHIISIIYIFLQKGRVDKHGRSSNRRAYAHSYE